MNSYLRHDSPTSWLRHSGVYLGFHKGEMANFMSGHLMLSQWGPDHVFVTFPMSMADFSGQGGWPNPAGQ